MDKLQFLDALLQAGYTAQLVNGVPTVLSDEITDTAEKIKDLAEKSKYNESFGVKKKQMTEAA